MDVSLVLEDFFSRSRIPLTFKLSFIVVLLSDGDGLQ